MPEVAPTSSSPTTGGKNTRASRILARSIFRDMRQDGYNCQQILALATELVDLVTKDMRGECEADLMPAPPTAQSAKSLRRVG
jgi:hypothetical protein